MEITDARILSKMNNYYVHLIAPALMKDEEIIKFQTNLREVMLFIKYSKDKEKLVRILEANEERFRQVERRAVDVIEIITHTGIKYSEGELKKAQESARNFYEMGIDIEKIAQGLRYALETVKQWLNLAV